jgi:hypothetical protein
MKRKIILLIGVCVVIFVAIGFSFVIHDARVMARGDYARSVINTLAVIIEEYKQEHHEYPKTLSELISDPDINAKDVLNQKLQILSNFKLNLEYQSQTNGFTISVTGIDSWRPSLNKIQQEFRAEETLN